MEAKVENQSRIRRDNWRAKSVEVAVAKHESVKTRSTNRSRVVSKVIKAIKVIKVIKVIKYP